MGIGDWGLGPIPNPQYYYINFDKIKEKIYVKFNLCLKYYINISTLVYLNLLLL